MEERRQIVSAQINENVVLMVETRGLGGEQDVNAGQLLDFQGVTDAIEALTGAIATTINKVKPDKATVELGLDVAVKSGKLTALLVEGTGKGNIKITLQWGQ